MKGLNKLADTSKLQKLKLAMLIAAISTGITTLGNSALAETSIVSEAEMLKEAVALYEKLSGTEVDVPEALASQCGDEDLGKAVLLGFANADEINSIANSMSLRKQDAMTVLYKTIIDFDDSFALSTEEIDEYLNKCCDNALIDEENRVGYAFMIKHGIIYTDGETNPDKIITWESCNILTDVLYNLFVQETEINVCGTAIKIGSNIETVTGTLGEPDRISPSDYDFDWYVYNKEYSNLVMVGVYEDRVCALYTNCSDFTFGDLKAGDDYLLTYKYSLDTSTRFYEDENGKLDAFMYNPRAKSENMRENNPLNRTAMLADLINANRVKNGNEPVKLSASLTETAASMAVQPKYIELANDLTLEHLSDNAQHEIGYDIFKVYSELVKSESPVFLSNTKVIGIGTSLTDNSSIMASVITGSVFSDDDDVISVFSAEELSNAISLPETVTTETNDISEIEEIDINDNEDFVESESDTVAKNADVFVNAGEDFVIDVADLSATEFFVKIYSIEDDDYAVNSYIKSTDGELTFNSALFTSGKDYSVLVTSTDGNTDSIEFTMSYGKADENAISIISPIMDSVSDNDFIVLEWESEIYHDFVADVYNEDGQLIISQPINNSYTAKINNVEPGHYYIYISAVRRGDNSIIKAQANVNVTVEMPEPIITEQILAPGEKYYPVYEDEEMGLVYFYDEDIIDVEVPSSNGKTTTVQRKKITQKQVKATGYYTKLANAQAKVEYFEGSTILATHKSTVYTDTSAVSGNISVTTSEFGEAIVEETKKYLGIPYLWGGTTINGFDCSGLVQYVYKNLGITLPRVSQQQYLVGTPISRENLIPGDLVFFSDNGDVHHVGIYAGNGMMIHAPYTGTVIQYQSIDTGIYKNKFCGGRRVF